MPKLFALVDCNNFYVSCERLFRPELRNRPVVVLSNNDGCIIARSNEAKALGIAMATPYFKARPMLNRYNVTVFSSNYALYGDLSHRVMTLLQEMAGMVDIYSIDEAFVGLPTRSSFDDAAWAAQIRERIYRCVGIPVSIGIGPTKTLAKIANRLAKKGPSRQGVFVFPAAEGDAILADIGVGEVWGIGRRSMAKLAGHGITNALQLKQADEKKIRRLLTITGARTALELNGISCLALDQTPVPRKSILSSRSFKTPVQEGRELKEAMATYTAMAAAKLRAQNLKAGALQVFISTSPFAKSQQPYAASRTLILPAASSHTPTLIALALQGLNSIHRDDLAYQKAGVMLTDLSSRSCGQATLFSKPPPPTGALMAAMDSINSRWGRNTLQYAVEGLAKPWAMRQDSKSPAYTTNWQDLPLVHCR